MKAKKLITASLLTITAFCAIPSFAANEIEVILVRPTTTDITFTRNANEDFIIDTTNLVSDVLIRTNQAVSPVPADLGFVTVLDTQNHIVGIEIRVTGVRNMKGIITTAVQNAWIPSIDITGNLTDKITSININSVVIGGDMVSGSSISVNGRISHLEVLVLFNQMSR